MKKLLFILPVCILAFACHKDPVPNNGGAGSGKLVSIQGYQGSSLFRADTFIYNSNGYLATQKEWSYSNGASTDSFVVKFNYAGNAADPVSYTFTDGSQQYTYTLSYDAQGRLAKDTSVPDYLGIASTFNYSPNAIVYNSADNGSTDTLFLSNNNIVKTVQGLIPPDPSQNVVDIYSYSGSYNNPLYNVGHTQNMRILLTKIDNWALFTNDFVSPNAFTKVTEGTYNVSLSYTTDASGRVAKANIMNTASLVFNYR